MDFGTYSLGLSEAGILALDFFTMLAALFFGGWYGIVLGLDWYSAVYGAKAEAKAGLFHAIVPHNWRKKHEKQDSLFADLPRMNVPETTKVTVTAKSQTKPAAKSVAKTIVKRVAKKTSKSSEKVVAPDVDSMSFEDFLRVTTEKKKTAAKKTTRRAPAKKTVKSAVKEIVKE